MFAHVAQEATALVTRWHNNFCYTVNIWYNILNTLLITLFPGMLQQSFKRAVHVNKKIHIHNSKFIFYKHPNNIFHHIIVWCYKQQNHTKNKSHPLKQNIYLMII